MACGLHRVDDATDLALDAILLAPLLLSWCTSSSASSSSSSSSFSATGSSIQSLSSSIHLSHRDFHPLKWTSAIPSSTLRTFAAHHWL